MDFQQLVCFKKVAELEHMTRASEELYISQSSLSIMIQKLETELGVQLFERKGRTICLNEYGKILMNHVDNMLESYESLEKEIRELYDRKYNSLTISSCTLFRFKGLYEEIYERYPDVKIEYLDYNYENMSDAIQSGKVDFCISPYSFDAPIQCTTISESNVRIIASKKHPITKIENPTIKDFEKYDFILYSDNYPIRHFQNQVMKEIGINPRISGISKGMQDSIAAVELGKFLTIVPDAVVSKDRTHENLVVYTLDNPNIKWGSVLSTCDYPGKRKIVKDIENIILNHFDK